MVRPQVAACVAGIGLFVAGRHFLLADGFNGSTGERGMRRSGAPPMTGSMRWAAIVMLAALAMISSHAQASLQFYTDKAAFQTAAPGLTTEDFEAATLAPSGYGSCSDPYDYYTNDACWTPGEVTAGIRIGSSSGTSGTLVIGPSGGAPSIVTGASSLTDALEVEFPVGTPAAGMDLIAGDLAPGVQEGTAISIFGANGVLLGSTTAQAVLSGEFFGVTSTQAIMRIELTSPQGPLVDNVSFSAPALGSLADAGVTLSGVENPVGTMNYTLTVTNFGPSTASGVLATVDMPAGISYVSDDCGGSNASPPWSRNIATLPLGAGVVCQIVATIAQPGVVSAHVVSSGSIDVNPTNDTALNGPDADLAISLTGVEASLGTMTYTMTVTNLGPDTASGIVASVDIPPQLAYVSDDCGGSNSSPPWSLHIATLALSGSVVCHIVTTVVSPQAVVLANVVASGSLDANPANDTATAYGPMTDLSVSITGVEDPPGSMMLTVTVTNLGPVLAWSIVASVTELPSALVYVSDDCGGSNSLLPWTWDIASLANGNSVVCHIQTTVATPQGLAVVASVVSSAQADPDNSNNQSVIYSSVTGPGPNTPDSGIALFRSFYDLALIDETGAAFSLRSHADKIMLLQVCAVWCGPCNYWTSLSSQLAQAVDQKIGAGHFLDVDMLTEGSSGTPSKQKDAQNWKTKYSFPGPVVHAEGSYTSPLWEFDIDRSAQYAAIQSSAFFPEFFILAPDCNNQIAVRAAPGAGILGEQRGVDTSTVDEMANLIADVWNDRPCVKPVVHRLDRCNVGSAQIYSNPQTADFAEAAEPFNVPNGQKYAISSVTSVTDASILDFTVYADAAGHPGTAVCTSTGRPASAVYAPGVKRIDLDHVCKLTSGNYWMSLKGHSDVDANFVPTWHGGFLPPDGSYFYRDNAGCTAWNAAGQCLAGQQDAQLCYVLETDVLFSSGFEPSVP